MIFVQFFLSKKIKEKITLSLANYVSFYGMEEKGSTEWLTEPQSWLRKYVGLFWPLSISQLNKFTG